MRESPAVLEAGEYWCPDCGSQKLDLTLSVGDAVCEDCGVVITDLENAQSPSSGIGNSSDDEKSVSWADYYTVTNSTEQQVAYALEHLEALSDELNLTTDTRTRAAEIYAEAAIANVTDGRPTQLVVAAAAVTGGREVGAPRPVRCVATVIDSPEKSLDRAVRILNRELDLTSTICCPEDYLTFLCRELDLGTEVEHVAREQARTVDESRSLVGKNPVGIAGALLYFASDGAVTQRAIAAAAGVTNETIRARLKDCRQLLQES